MRADWASGVARVIGNAGVEICVAGMRAGAVSVGGVVGVGADGRVGLLGCLALRGRGGPVGGAAGRSAVFGRRDC